MPSKVSKLFTAFSRLLRNPRLLNLILDDGYWRDYVMKRYSLPFGLPIVKTSQFTEEKDLSVYPYTFLDGGSLPTDLLLLNRLASSIPDCRYFEIGTWRGESVANVARFAKSCHTLDLPAESLRAMGRAEDYIREQGRLSKELPNVTQLYGDTRTFDFDALGRNFDLIFIDGDHHYAMVAQDTRRVIERLAGPGTIIVWHDYAHNPENVRFEVLAGILEGIPAGMRNSLYHVEHTKCAIYLPLHIQGKAMKEVMQAEDLFELNISKKQ